MVLVHVFALAYFRSAGNFDTHGKSNAEIYEMGGDRWVKFLVSQTNESFANYNGAWTYYKDLVAQRNHQDLARLAPRDQNTIKQMQYDLHTFSSNVTSIAKVIAAGGNMWDIVESVGSAKAEETISYVLHPRHGDPLKPATESQIMKRLDKLGAAADRINYPGRIAIPKIALRKELSYCRVLCRQIAEFAATQPKEVSYRILDFCLSRIRIPSEG